MLACGACQRLAVVRLTPRGFPPFGRRHIGSSLPAADGAAHPVLGVYIKANELDAFRCFEVTSLVSIIATKLPKSRAEISSRSPRLRIGPSPDRPVLAASSRMSKFLQSRCPRLAPTPRKRKLSAHRVRYDHVPFSFVVFENAKFSRCVGSCDPVFFG